MENVKLKNILENLKIGLGVAEQETDLSSYFVETNQWRCILNGDIDIVYGPKGSGKSALYTLLTANPDEEPDKIIISADNPRGSTVFKKVEVRPPTTELEFQGLWKLYFAALIGNFFDKKSDTCIPQIVNLIEVLQSENLIDKNKETILTRILAIISHVREISGSASTNPLTGENKLEWKIVLDETQIFPNSKQISVDRLVEMANEGLAIAKKTVWIAIDRLDVAFIDNAELEENALRALFHCYLDLLRYENIKLKIFLRTDIWRRLTAGKSFPEASHIVKKSIIQWSEEQLLNLIMKRLLNNQPILEHYKLDRDDVLSNFDKQKRVFDLLFPKQVDPGPKRPSALSWMLSRTADGTQQTAPRELIQLLNQAKNEQIRNMEIGASDVDNDELFGKSAIKKALDDVSRTRLDQTIYPEYPALKTYIEKLEGQKAEQTLPTLGTLWKTSPEITKTTTTRLVEIGFFEKRGSGDLLTFWIPFIYRPALKIIQGKEDWTNYGSL